MEAEKQSQPSKQSTPSYAHLFQSKPSFPQARIQDNRPLAALQAKLINDIQKNDPPAASNCSNRLPIQRQLILHLADADQIIDNIDQLHELMDNPIPLSPYQIAIIERIIASPNPHEFGSIENLLSAIESGSSIAATPPSPLPALIIERESPVVASYPMLRQALPIIHHNGYFVESILTDGSTRPAVLRDLRSGKCKVLKLGGKDPNHIISEFLSCKLYEAVGAPILETELVSLGDRPGMMTEYVDQPERFAVENLRLAEDFRRFVAMDFLLGNWDIVKPANWIKRGGRYFRLDNGGALIFKAQGGLKTPEEWGPDKIQEMDTTANKSMVKSRSLEENPFFELDQDTTVVSIKYLLNSLFPGTTPNVAELSDLGRDRFCRIIAAVGLDPSQDLLASIQSILIPRLLTLAAYSAGEMRYEIITIQHPSVPEQVIPMRPLDYVDLSEDPKIQKLRRMQGGFLIRRLGKKEALAFRQATQAQDIQRVRSLLFDERPSGGEIVFSVNYPHRFRDEGGRSSNDYSLILEIPITNELIGYLAAIARDSRTEDTRGPAPVLKEEGGESEHRGLDLPDLPNVLIKQGGIQDFWRVIREIRIIPAEKYRTLRPEKDLAQKRREKEMETARKRREAKQEAEREARAKALREYEERKRAGRSEEDPGEEFSFSTLFGDK